MTPELKEKLLQRLFTSLEYMEAFTNYYAAGLQAAEDAFTIFEKKYRINSSLSSRYAMEYRQWSERVIPNFRGMKENAILALDNAKQGKTSTIRSAAGNLRSLSKDMDGIGWDWWDEVDSSYWKFHAENMNKAEQLGNNIYYTLSNFWDDDEILNEKITGPIDENVLLKYLQTGEQP